MKSIKSISAILFITGFFFSANAQTAADEAAVKNFYNDVWQTYISLDLDKVSNIYVENLVSIDPGGGLTKGRKQLREAMEGFLKMIENKPTFTYDEPTIQFLTPTVVVLTYTYTDDIMIQGQQVGGKKTSLAVIQKINGKWLIAADATVPVQVMPDQAAQTEGKN